MVKPLIWFPLVDLQLFVASCTRSSNSCGVVPLSLYADKLVDVHILFTTPFLAFWLFIPNEIYDVVNCERYFKLNRTDDIVAIGVETNDAFDEPVIEIVLLTPCIEADEIVL